MFSLLSLGIQAVFIIPDVFLVLSMNETGTASLPLVQLVLVSHTVSFPIPPFGSPPPAITLATHNYPLKVESSTDPTLP